MNPVSLRLLNQQLAAPLFSTPEEVVEHMGAMQAQEECQVEFFVEGQNADIGKQWEIYKNHQTK